MAHSLRVRVADVAGAFYACSILSYAGRKPEMATKHSAARKTGSPSKRKAHKARVDRHGQGQALCPPRRHRTIQGRGRRGSFASARPATQSQDDGQGGARRPRRSEAALVAVHAQNKPSGALLAGSSMTRQLWKRQALPRYVSTRATIKLPATTRWPRRLAHVVATHRAH